MALEDNPIYRLQKAVLDRKRSPFTVLKETETQKFQSALTKDHFREVLEYTRSIMDQDLETASSYAQFNLICADREKLGEELYNDIQSVRETILKRMRAPREALWEQTTTKEAFEEKMVRLGLNVTNTELEIQKAIQHYGSAENYLKDLQSEKNTLSKKGMEIEVAKYEMKIADLYKKTGQFNDSKSHYQSAKNTFEKNKMDMESAICSFRTSSSCRALEEFDDAKNQLLSAREIFERQGMGIEYVICTLEISSLSLDIGPDLFALDDVLKVKEFFKRSSLDDQTAKCDFVAASIYSKLNQYSDAIEYFQSARKSYEEQGMEEDVAKCDRELGTLYSAVGKYEMALALLETTKENFSKRAQEIEVAKCDVAIGNVYKRIGEFTKALDQYESARRTYSDKARKKEVALCHLEISNIFQLLADPDSALLRLNEAKKLFLEMEMRTESSKCDLNITNMQHQDLKQLKKDLELLLAKRETPNDKAGRSALAQWESDLGELYNKYGFLEEAITHYEISKRIYEEEGLTSAALQCDVRIGNSAYRDLNITGQASDLSWFDKDLECLQSMRDRYKELGDDGKVAEYEFQIGDIYKKYSQFGRALEHYESAKRHFSKERREIEVAGCNGNIGIMYHELGQAELALKYLQETKKICQEIKSHIDLAQCDFSIANVFKELGRTEEALQLYNSALKFFEKKRKLRDWVGRCKHNIALVYSGLGRHKEAATLFRSARKIFDHLGMDDDVASCDLNMAISERDAGRYKEALAKFEQVYETCRHIPEIKFRSLWGMSRTEKLLGEPEKAVKFLMEGIEAAENIRALISQREYRSSYLESVHEAYRDMIELCLEVKDFKKALEYVEGLKSRNLAEMLASKERIPKNATEEEVREYRNLHKQLVACSNQLKESNALLTLDLQESMEKLEDQYKTLVKGLREKDPDFDPEEQVRVSYEEMKELAGDMKSAIIELFPTENKTIVFIVSGIKDAAESPLVIKTYDTNHLKMHVDELSARFDAFQEAETFSEKNRAREEWESYLDEVLKDLYSKIFSEIEPHIKGLERIIFIPYGGFHLLPLHAMYREDNGTRHYIIDDYLVTYSPSTKILKQCKSRNRERKDKAALFLSNPSGTKELIFTKDELKEITNILNNSRITYNATRKNVIEQGKECNIFHFAGHAHFKGLILHGDEGNTGVDEYSIEDMFVSLDLPETYLATLSACETGKVLKEKNIDEYIGLPSGLLNAGAATVISSLWCVEDYSTSLLMRKIYRTIKEGRGKGEALVEAQRWLKDQKNREEHFKMLNLEGDAIREDYHFDFTRPYHWAGFICSGVS